MADVLMGFHRSTFSKPNTEFNLEILRKKRPSPHLHKVPTRSNKASPRTLQTALVIQTQLFINFGLTTEMSRTVTSAALEGAACRGEEVTGSCEARVSIGYCWMLRFTLRGSRPAISLFWTAQ
jgi:hypothetical protein